MSEPILIAIDSSEIHEGKLVALKTAVHELASFVESNETRHIAYNIYIDESGTRMTVVQVHPDSASMEYHMEVAAEAFSKFTGLIKLTTMDIYGTPSDTLLEQLRNKVRMLGTATVTVHKLHAGFIRL